MFSQATIFMALAASASAHMVMHFPVPYGNSTLNNSPLGASDFPCKQRTGVYDITEMNQWNAGQTQEVSFMGSAVHGGGSCQFSITTDLKPTVNTQWKVIHSVVGGCPAAVPGNLPSGQPNDLGAAKFPVTMPTDLPDGQYTFAWTWINKVGQREFYMNCAPIQVGSGQSANTASAATTLSTLPEMYVANLPNTECATTEGQDFDYPNPGQSVTRGSGSNPGSTISVGKCPNALGNPSAGTPTQSGTPSQSQVSSKPSASAPVAAPSPAKSSAAASSGYSGGVFAPGASSAPASQSAAQPVASASPQPSKDTPNNTTPVNGDCTPCTNDGAVVCIGSKQFGLCNRGCAVAQDLAAGMACTNGVVVGATKRHVHFPRAHLHRRLTAARLF